VQDVRCIPTTLERTLQYGLDLLPYEVEDTKIKSIGSPSLSHKNVSVVGRNVGAISFPRSHRPTKKMIQVSKIGK
jgi:hypothetical protein